MVVLISTHDPDKVAAFVAEVERWAGSGAAVAGNAQLCARVLEPTMEGSDAAGDGWRIELLARDLDEPSIPADAIGSALPWADGPHLSFAKVDRTALAGTARPAGTPS